MAERRCWVRAVRGSRLGRSVTGGRCECARPDQGRAGARVRVAGSAARRLLQQVAAVSQLTDTIEACQWRPGSAVASPVVAGGRACGRASAPPAASSSAARSRCHRRSGRRRRRRRVLLGLQGVAAIALGCAVDRHQLTERSRCHCGVAGVGGGELGDDVARLLGGGLGGFEVALGRGRWWRTRSERDGSGSGAARRCVVAGGEVGEEGVGALDRIRRMVSAETPVTARSCWARSKTRPSAARAAALRLISALSRSTFAMSACLACLAPLPARQNR